MIFSFFTLEIYNKGSGLTVAGGEIARSKQIRVPNVLAV